MGEKAMKELRSKREAGEDDSDSEVEEVESKETPIKHMEKVPSPEPPSEEEKLRMQALQSLKKDDYADGPKPIKPLPKPSKTDSDSEEDQAIVKKPPKKKISKDRSAEARELIESMMSKEKKKSKKSKKYSDTD